MVSDTLDIEVAKVETLELVKPPVPQQVQGVFTIFDGLPTCPPLRPYAYIYQKSVLSPIDIVQSDEELGLQVAPSQSIGDLDDNVVGYIPVYKAGKIIPPIGFYLECTDSASEKLSRGQDGSVTIKAGLPDSHEPLFLGLKKLNLWSVSTQGCDIYHGINHQLKYDGVYGTNFIDAWNIQDQIVWGNRDLQMLRVRSLNNMYQIGQIHDLNSAIELSHAVLAIISEFREWQDRNMGLSNYDFIPGEVFGFKYSQMYPYLDLIARNTGKFSCTESMAANALADFLLSIGIKCQVAKVDSAIVDDRSVAWTTSKDIASSDKVVVYLPDGRVAFVDPFRTTQAQTDKLARLDIFKSNFVPNYCLDNGIDINDILIWMRIDQARSYLSGEHLNLDMVYGLSLYRELPPRYRPLLTTVFGYALSENVCDDEVRQFIQEYRYLPGLPLFFKYALNFKDVQSLMSELSAKWFSNEQSGIKVYGVQDLFDEFTADRLTSLFSRFRKQIVRGKQILTNPLNRRQIVKPVYSQELYFELDDNSARYLPAVITDYMNLIKIYKGIRDDWVTDIGQMENSQDYLLELKKKLILIESWIRTLQ